MSMAGLWLAMIDCKVWSGEQGECTYRAESEDFVVFSVLNFSLVLEWSLVQNSQPDMGQQLLHCAKDVAHFLSGSRKITLLRLPAWVTRGNLSLLYGQTEYNSRFDLDSSRQVINAAYAEAVHFRPNLLSVPSGATGEQYVSIIARLYQCFGDAAAGEGMSIKVAMVATQVLLQQPYRMVDSRKHADCLQRRLLSWDTGDIDELMTEARTIQQQIQEATNRSSREERAKDDSEARRFAVLVMDGKIGSATRMLDCDSKGGLHRLDNGIGDHTVREKHPAASPLNEDAVMDGEPLPQPHPVIFTALNRDVVRQAALRTHGAAGPSSMDAANWRKICTSFHSASDVLCDALVTCARRIATKDVDPISVEAYVACRLVPLNKQPGVRPIRIGEVVRRILGKAILEIVGSAVESAVGCLQLCGGQECGVEAAIHAVKTTFDDDHTEGVLFADATIAFNRLNRAVCLRNVQRLCPELAPAIINTYRSPVCWRRGDPVF